jgi:hypothetical protein
MLVATPLLALLIGSLLQIDALPVPKAEILRRAASMEAEKLVKRDIAAMTASTEKQNTASQDATSAANSQLALTLVKRDANHIEVQAPEAQSVSSTVDFNTAATLMKRNFAPLSTNSTLAHMLVKRGAPPAPTSGKPDPFANLPYDRFKKKETGEATVTAYNKMITAQGYPCTSCRNLAVNIGKYDTSKNSIAAVSENFFGFGLGQPEKLPSGCGICVKLTITGQVQIKGKKIEESGCGYNRLKAAVGDKTSITVILSDLCPAKRPEGGDSGAPSDTGGDNDGWCARQGTNAYGKKPHFDLMVETLPPEWANAVHEGGGMYATYEILPRRMCTQVEDAGFVPQCAETGKPIEMDKGLKLTDEQKDCAKFAKFGNSSSEQSPK